jgi:hypothetical protein
VKKPVGEGRQRFALHGKKNVPKFKFFFIALAQLVSKNMPKIAPTAFSNMTNHIQPANKCRLGQSLFSGGTVLADGMVHAHFDPFDYCLGASSIHSYSKPSQKPQLHFAQMMKYVLSTSNRQYCRNCQHCHQNLDYELISAKVAKNQLTHQWLDVQRHNKLYNFCSHCLKCAMLIPKPPALPVLAPAISQPIPV